MRFAAVEFVAKALARPSKRPTFLVAATATASRKQLRQRIERIYALLPRNALLLVAARCGVRAEAKELTASKQRATAAAAAAANAAAATATATATATANGAATADTTTATATSEGDWGAAQEHALKRAITNAQHASLLLFTKR